MNSLLLKEARSLLNTYTDRVLHGASLYIEDGVIEKITVNPIPGTKHDYVIDCKDKVVLPGLGNAHTHLPMTLFRGLADDLPLESWLNQKIWPLEHALKPWHVRAGAELGLIELIKNGVTAFADMYFYEDSVVTSALNAGLRILATPAVFDFEFKHSTLSDALKIIESGHSDSCVRWGLGPQSTYSCKEETFEKIRDVSKSKNLSVHTHLAESRWSQARCEREYGKRETNFLDDHDLLSPSLIAAHAVWITKEEARLLGKKGAYVVFCPVSNMKLAEGGVAPVPELLETGVKVCFGTDGAASNNSLNVLETVKTGLLLIKHSRWDPSLLKAQFALKMATEWAYDAMKFPKHSLDIGGAADLFTVDLKTPSMHCAESVSFASRLAYANPTIKDVVVNGKPVMLDQCVQSLNEDKVFENFKEALFDLQLGSVLRTR
jgi:5-methylthioadenosine/S-adenosylhomocysteine deaminase